MNVWTALFKGEVGGKPSKQQCDAAAAVFGSAIPEIERQCARVNNYPALAKQVVEKVMDSETIQGKLQGIVDSLNELANQLAELDSGITEIEKQRAEKRFLTPRLSQSLMGDDDSWHNPAILTGRKTQPTEGEKQPGDWINDALRYGVKPKERRSQHWSHYVSSGWYKKSWF